MNQELKEWQVPTLCECCNSVIWSRYSGEFVWCSCKTCAVDQTPHYSRYIGEMGLMENLNENL